MQWRSAIGRFHVTCVSKHLADRFRVMTKHIGENSRCAGVGDVLFTWICLLFLACFVASLKQNLVFAVNEPFLHISLLSLNKTYVSDFSLITMLSPNSEYGSHWSTVSSVVVRTMPVACVGLYALFAFASHRVLLSGDVEQNPGPVDTVKDNSASQINDATLSDSIKHLEVSLQQKLDIILKTIDTQSGILKQQEETLKRQGELLKQQGESLAMFGVEQKALKESVTGLSTEVRDVKSSVQKNERAIGGLAEKQDKLNKTVSNLEAEIDRLEGFSRRNNVKMFGIPEAPPGKKEDCAEAVTRVLLTYIPEENWDTNVIERAHRLGRLNPLNPTPRPIIAKFQSWKDLMRVMRDRKARGDMENDGLRLAQDLTKRQVAGLKSLRAEGRVGYFVNGKLRVKDQHVVQNRDQREINQNCDGENDDQHEYQESTTLQRSPTRLEAPCLFTEATEPTHPSQPIGRLEITDDVMRSQGQSNDNRNESRSPLHAASERPQTRSMLARGSRQSTLNWSKHNVSARAGESSGGVSNNTKK